MKFHITNIEKTVEEFTWEHGAKGREHRTIICEYNLGTVKPIISEDGIWSLKGLLHEVYGFPDENAGWMVFADGRISTNQIENRLGHVMEEGDSDYEGWKAGNIQGWIADYSVSFEIIHDTHVPEVAEVCKLFDLPDYDQHYTTKEARAAIVLDHSKDEAYQKGFKAGEASMKVSMEKEIASWWKPGGKMMPG